LWWCKPTIYAWHGVAMLPVGRSRGAGVCSDEAWVLDRAFPFWSSRASEKLTHHPKPDQDLSSARQNFAAGQSTQQVNPRSRSIHAAGQSTQQVNPRSRSTIQQRPLHFDICQIFDLGSSAPRRRRKQATVTLWLSEQQHWSLHHESSARLTFTISRELGSNAVL
jgi:hypothetical protein